MTLTIRQTIFFGCLLATVSAAQFFLIDRANANLDREMALLNQADRSASSLRRANRSFAQADRGVAALDTAIASFDRKRPTAKEITLMLNDLEQIAQASSLQCSVRQAPSTQPANYPTLRPATLTLGGDFNAVYSFIAQLEHRSPYIAISAVKLQAQPEQDGQVSANIDLQICCNESAETSGSGAR